MEQEYIDVVIALHNYTSQEPSCLSFRRGDIIYVCAQDPSGWWDGALQDGQKGWFPSNYVKKYVPQQAAPQRSNSNQVEAVTQQMSQMIMEAQNLGQEDDGGEFPQRTLSSDSKSKVLDIPQTPTLGAHATTYVSPIAAAATPLANPAATGAVQLPPFWGRKTTPQGVEYYFNVQTNRTTFDLQEVLQSQVSKRRSQVILNDVRRSSNTLEAVPENVAVAMITSTGQPVSQSPIPETSRQHSWIPGPQSLIDGQAPLTWELLVDNILRAISDLNYSTKSNNKALYVSQTNQVVRAIRDMLAASGTINKNSVVMQNNRQLRTHHQQILTSLSRLVLAAKVASGLWPPPDAVGKLRHMAGQVLMAIRHFVSTAKELPLELQPIRQYIVDDFDVRGAELSESEFVNRLDQSSESAITSIARLVNMMTQNNRVSSVLIDQVRMAVTEIGQFLSLIEDIRIVNPDEAHDDVLTQFQYKKDILYAVVNDMVAAARAAMDSFAPPNAVVILFECSSVVLQTLDDLLITTKLVVDQRELIEQRNLQIDAEYLEQEDDSELSQLQRRAMSLTFPANPVKAPQGTAPSRTSAPATFNPYQQHVRTPSDSQRPASTGTPAKPVDASTVAPPRDNSKRISGEPLNAAKLSKGVGDEVAGPNMGRRGSLDPTSDKWYLSYDYSPHELSHTPDGQINGGTLKALVERLTIHDIRVDSNFSNCFLMMLHSFTTPEELLETLIARFRIQPPPNLSPEDTKIWTEKKATPIRIRVFNALKLWLEKYWSDDFDKPILPKLQEFLSAPGEGVSIPMPARLSELVNERTKGSGLQRLVSKRAVNASDCPAVKLPSNLRRFTTIDIPPVEIARQMTLIANRTFCEIEPIELLNQEWQKKQNSVATHVLAMSRMSNRITSWIVESILSETDLKKRGKLVNHFVLVGEQCLALQNYDSLMAILVALQSSTISRLKRTWDQLPPKSKQLFDDLKLSIDMSRNYADYRATIRNAITPCLPFVGVYLSDLVFIEDGNPKLRNNGTLLNFDKYAKLYKVILEIQRFQQPYMLMEVTEIQEFLNNAIELSGRQNEEQLYEISLLLEPRENSDRGDDAQRELQNKIRLLEDAGLI